MPKAKKIVSKGNPKSKKERSVFVSENYAKECIRNFEAPISPVPYDYLKRLSEAIIDYSMHPDTYSFYSFLTKLPHSRNQIYEWAAKHPIVKNALDIARAQFALKRENRAAEDKNYAVVYKTTAAVYDHELRDHITDMEKLKASLKVDTEETKPIVIVMKDMPSVDKVPEKNKDKF